MMKLIIGFSTTNLLISRLIRSFTGSKVSHCYVRFYDTFLNMSLVAHADFPGVVIETSERFNRHNTVVEEFELDDARMFVLLRKNLELLRVKYAFRELIGWSWFLVFKKMVRVAVSNPLEIPEKIICAEFVARFLKCFDLPKVAHTPETLRVWMKENYEKFGWRYFVGTKPESV